MQKKKEINLPVSLRLTETYGSYAPSMNCTFSDYFIFGITFLSCLCPVFFSLGDLNLFRAELLSRSTCII